MTPAADFQGDLEAPGEQAASAFAFAAQVYRDNEFPNWLWRNFGELRVLGFTARRNTQGRNLATART
jgi:hypothetical protein